ALPDHPQGPLSLFRVRASRGDENAGESLDHALRLITDQTDWATRILVGDALSSAQRFDEVITLLQSRTSTKRDSTALRALISAAINADRRALARSIFRELPSQVLEMRFYRKARIALE